VSKLTGECRPCTFIGVLAGGIAGFVVCYCTLSFGSIYNDPSKSGFIMDPLMVAFVAFFLCCHIAYDFCALLDHMADSLLYCFAYNKCVYSFYSACETLAKHGLQKPVSFVLETHVCRVDLIMVLSPLLSLH